MKTPKITTYKDYERELNKLANHYDRDCDKLADQYDRDCGRLMHVLILRQAKCKHRLREPSNGRWRECVICGKVI